jgi:hypothetical protein
MHTAHSAKINQAADILADVIADNIVNTEGKTLEEMGYVDALEYTFTELHSILEKKVAKIFGIKS